MCLAKLKTFLDSQHIKYVRIIHSPAYTAQETAEAARLAGREVAKTVMVKLDGQMAMAVLPGNRKVILEDLRDATGATEAKFATEKEFKDLFPGCETGAMPPFGNLFDMKVYVSAGLTEHADIAFNAGSHAELVKLAYKDYERLVQPTVCRFST
jgi:Ala-tRNA(Pro) deacylase